MTFSTGVFAAQLLASGFLGILFLQSGLDKVFDWAGNRSYISGYFEKTPLRRFTAPMLMSITVLEVLAGGLSAAGFVANLWMGRRELAFGGACVSAVSILGLFFGQRLAKDYAGAAGMVPYIIAITGALLLQSS
jgi:uncharacterized membrane protein YphA (DoxX/SURF4 family)